MVRITSTVTLDESELKISFIRASGPGGQNVNKVATAVQLRFNVRHSPSLPEAVRERLLHLLGPKVTAVGDLIIKATRHRTQERNRQDALDRLVMLVKRATIVPKKRKKTKATLASKERRLQKKKIHGKRKALRGKVHEKD